MNIYDIVLAIALALSLTSVIMVAITLLRTYSHVKTLIEELGNSIIIRKRYKRVKRYILVKFLCLEDKDSYTLFADIIKQHIYSTLGFILKHKCSIDVVSFRPNNKRAVLRVRGEASCVLYTLLALSIQHIEKSNHVCIVIPIRTSGLISRLYRRYLKQ